VPRPWQRPPSRAPGPRPGRAAGAADRSPTSIQLIARYRVNPGAPPAGTDGDGAPDVICVTRGALDGPEWGA